VNARLIAPDGSERPVDSGAKTTVGTYRSQWGEGAPEGLWRFVVDATDDLGRTSQAERSFFVNNTLGSLRVPRTALVRAGRQLVIGTFTLTRSATVTTRIESTNGVVVRKLGTGTVAAGRASVRWDGRDRRGNLVYGGRYVLRVRAQNQFGPTELTQAFLAHR